MAKAKILIVEDERITAENICMTLDDLGYETCGIASSKKEAIEKTAQKNPDLVLMDIRLHGTMEGIGAANLIRSHFSIPVVYLTAHADEKTLNRARITEPFGYILKPFDKRDLHSTIEIALHKHGMEKKLRRTQEWLSTTLKNIRDAVIATDTNGYVTYMNLMAEVLTGWKKEEALGERLNKVFMVTGNDRNKRRRNPVTEVLKKGEVLNLSDNLMLKNGNGNKIPIILNGAPVSDEQGNTAEVVFAFRDISERQHIEEVLEHTKASFSSIVEKNNDGIIIVDRNGAVRFINPAAAVFFGKNKKRYIGKKFRFQVAKVKSGEIEIVRLNGKPGVGEMHVVETEWERKPGYLVSIRDITDRKRLFEELEKAHQQQIQTRDQFLSHISHELRTPLSAIHQFVTILLDGLDGDINPTQKEDLEIILKNANQLNLMIRDLLDVTRAITGRLTINPLPLSISETTSWIINSFRRRAAAKGILLYSDIQNELPPVYSDPVRIRQVLNNLIDNAIKFTPENETIAVRASLFHKDHDFICVEVMDTGCGIDPDEKAKIFKYLYQSKYESAAKRKGLGLGLFICREIVFRHGGEIWVESKPGKGSSFYFTLPVFSLLRLLSPLLTSESRRRGYLSVFTVKIVPPDKPFLPKIWENIIQVTQDVLQNSLFPDLDVLLPTANFPGLSGSFFLAANRSKREAERMIKRIKKQLELCDILQNSGVELSISISKINISGEDVATTLDQIVKKVKKKMERAGESSYLQRGELR